MQEAFKRKRVTGPSSREQGCEQQNGRDQHVIVLLESV